MTLGFTPPAPTRVRRRPASVTAPAIGALLVAIGGLLYSTVTWVVYFANGNEVKWVYHTATSTWATVPERFLSVAWLTLGVLTGLLLISAVVSLFRISGRVATILLLALTFVILVVHVVAIHLTGVLSFGSTVGIGYEYPHIIFLLAWIWPLLLAILAIATLITSCFGWDYYRKRRQPPSTSPQFTQGFPVGPAGSPTFTPQPFKPPPPGMPHRQMPAQAPPPPPTNPVGPHQ